MKSVKIFSIICMVMVFNLIMAQDYKMHKIYIYNFTKYIVWPANMQKGEFVIGVLGSQGMADEMREVAKEKKVGEQKILIKEFSNPADVIECHILFIAGGKSASFSEVSQKLNGKPVLIITEKVGLGSQGSGINFLLMDGKLKYEVNKTSFEKSGLKISNELTKLAINIFG